MALSGTLNWMTNAIISLFFLDWISIVNFDYMFWIFAGIAFFALIFIFFFVPETKNRTVERIYFEWNRKK